MQFNSFIKQYYGIADHETLFSFNSLAVRDFKKTTNKVEFRDCHPVFLIYSSSKSHNLNVIRTRRE